MSFRDRLEKAAAHAGVPVKQSAIARFLGLPKQTIHQWFNGTTPEPRFSNDAAVKFKVNPIWFATGEGEMIPKPAETGLTTEERDLIKFYRNAQPQRRKALYDMAKALGKAVVVAALSVPFQINDAQAEGLHKTTWSAAFIHIVKIIINIAKQRAFQYA